MLRIVLPVLACLGIAAPVSAQSCDGHAGVPLAEAAITAISAPDSAARSDFVTQHFGPAMLAARRADEWTGWLERIHAQSGHGVMVERFECDPVAASAFVRTARGDSAVMRAVPLRSDPERLYMLIVERDHARFVLPEGADRAAALEAFSEWVDALTAADAFSGVVLLADGDDILLHRAWGSANRDLDVPNSIGNRFQIASVGKMFTGVAIAQLVAEGQLAWDDRISDLLPEYADVPAFQGVTLHHLLTHTSGLGGPRDRPGFDVLADPGLPGDQLAGIAAQEGRFEPGARWSYSNDGYNIAAAIVERVTGRPFPDVMNARIFQPAGMTQTGNESTAGIVAGRATGYLRDGFADPLEVALPVPNHLFLGAGRSDGSGGQYATALDLYRFVTALRDGRLLPSDVLSAVTMPHVPGGSTPAGPFHSGYGFFIETVAGETTWGHEGGGEDGGVSASVRAFANGGPVIVVVSNLDSPSAQRVALAAAQVMALR